VEIKGTAANPAAGKEEPKTLAEKVLQLAQAKADRREAGL
jgi:hypothetical protein